MMNETKDFLERPGTIRALWLLLWAICGLTVGLEFFFERRPHFDIDGFFGFSAVLGFVACALLILLAKLLGFALKRKENYYD